MKVSILDKPAVSITSAPINNLETGEPAAKVYDYVRQQRDSGQMIVLTTSP